MMFKVGQKSSFSKTITESDVMLFAGICGDFNPVHINREEAEKSVFGERVVHGALIASFVSTVLGMYLPGPGTIYLSQESRFLKPVFLNDTVTATAEIERLDEKNRAVLLTRVMNQRNEFVLDGKATVILPYN